MIQTRTRLSIADNSGAREVMCIGVFGGSGRRFAYIGDLIKVSVKVALPNGKIKKGEVFSALVVRTRNFFKKYDGSSVRFDDNAVVLLNEKMEFIGTRVIGPIIIELKHGKYAKFFSLVQDVV